MYKITEASDILRTAYLDIITNEILKTNKTKHSTRLGCCKCGATGTTLRKVGENRICDKCYKRGEQ